ncbi:MAG: hybrid sensor histidine kinase/response regulator [Opitutales bacterium]
MLPQIPEVDLKEALILVVDDSALGNRILAQALEPHNCRVMAEVDTQQALITAVESQPDLILYDFQMAVDDGLEFCRQVQATEATANIPIIIISGGATRDELVSALDAGAVDFITKPFDFIELGYRIRNHIELRRARQSLTQANAKLESLNKKKDEFLGIAAHDLRNPLSGINGFAELMLLNTKLDGEKREKYLKYILETSQYMTTLLNNFLDISKIEQEAFDIKIAETDVAAVAENVIRLNEESSIKKEQKLEVRIEAGLPVVQSDANVLLQLFANLLSNGIKYSPLGGDILVQVRVIDSSIQFAVKDSGPGISEEDQKKLFVGYARLDTEPTGGEKANGLGLAIVGKLGKKIGATMGVKSKLGAGSLFWVNIPIDRCVPDLRTRPPF